MATQPAHATLTIQLDGNEHSSASVAVLVQAVDGLASAAVWASLLYADEGLSPEFHWAREQIADLRRDKASGRFYPQFVRPARPRNRWFPSAVNVLRDFDADDPLDFAVTVGTNLWLRKELESRDRERADRLFSFAEISRLEHRSPLLIELSVAIGVTALVSALILYGAMKAASHLRKMEEDRRREQLQEELQREDLKQRRIQTEILQVMRDAVVERQAGGQLTIPDAALVAAATISSPAVREISKSPLIGSVSLGVTGRMSP